MTNDEGIPCIRPSKPTPVVFGGQLPLRVAARLRALFCASDWLVLF
jgi:hypothetical protein